MSSFLALPLACTFCTGAQEAETNTCKPSTPDINPTISVDNAGCTGLRQELVEPYHLPLGQLENASRLSPCNFSWVTCRHGSFRGLVPLTTSSLVWVLAMRKCQLFMCYSSSRKECKFWKPGTKPGIQALTSNITSKLPCLAALPE